MTREDFKSLIPAERTLPELTLKAISVGILLAILLGAANAYLGLYAGMTVSAVIPGAVMAFALMRPFKGNILEVTLGMMGAASGEALAAGVIFTIPSLVILQRYMGCPGWSHIHYLETTLIALIGGILGVLWMVPLRRALIVKTDLPFPEGVAVAAVLTTTVGEGRGQRRTRTKTEVSPVWLLTGLFISAFFKFGQLSLRIFRGMVEGIASIGKYIIGGVQREGWIYGGIATSPALLGVGWIIGPRIATLVFIGGLIGWVIIAPLVVLVGGMPPGTVDPLTGFYKIWGDQIRYIGVGAMLVGGLWTIWTLRSNLAAGIREAVLGIRRGAEVTTRKRTDTDLNLKTVFLIIGAFVIPVFIVYALVSQMYALSGFMAVFAIIMAFVASAIAGYMAGLVGSSNNPISGVTVSVLLITSLILFAAGIGVEGVSIAILIAALICCGAAISGDVLQSMACGWMVGATPWKQQIAEIIGVSAAAPILALVIQMLDNAFKIGSKDLPAPQAFLMAGIVKGILGGKMIWPYVLVGAILAFILILLNLPVLPVAIGIYLPFTLSTPIFVGGILRYFTNKFIEKKFGKGEEEISDWELAIKQTGIKPRERAIRTGLLLTAGFVAGEALMGVAIAALYSAHIDLSLFPAGQEPWWPGLLVWAYIGALLLYIPLRCCLAEK
ncbi:MAG: oligopeptide transporter, OPT family [Thermoplasmata archaeon]|nr:MAG: oligopeptide transporter, OPT family [Thermoplasmata archaeon]